MEGFRNDVKFVDVTYRIHRTQFKEKPVVSIHTEIKGDNVYEINTCYLSDDRQLEYVFQRSQNQREKLDYIWEVYNHSHRGRVHYLDKRNERPYTASFDWPDQGYSLQALFYFLITDSYSVGKAYSYKLLVPPDKFYDMYVYIKRELPVTYKGKTVPGYEIELGLSGVIGLFIPKFYFFVSKAYPHIPISYKNRGEVFSLSHFREY